MHYFCFRIVFSIDVYMTWRPSASVSTLQQRAHLLARIRNFFCERNVLEVDTPCIGEYSVTDPHLEGIVLQRAGAEYFLQTSPEYFMKRLLAAGSGDIYSLGKAFREDEVGRIHSPEFTMLEWYRLGFDEQALIDEVIALMRELDAEISVTKASYGELFIECCGIDPHACSADDLARYAKAHLDIGFELNSKSDWLDLLFTHCVEPSFGEGLVVVYDYPSCQSALARVVDNASGVSVAKRFECYLNGVELANGYWELTDYNEQKRRFAADNQARLDMGKIGKAVDPYFLAALEQGLPECSGVALGVDRLMMALLTLDSIAEQRTF